MSKRHHRKPIVSFAAFHDVRVIKACQIDFIWLFSDLATQFYSLFFSLWCRYHHTVLKLELFPHVELLRTFHQKIWYIFLGIICRYITGSISILAPCIVCFENAHIFAATLGWVSRQRWIHIYHLHHDKLILIFDLHLTGDNFLFSLRVEHSFIFINGSRIGVVHIKLKLLHEEVLVAIREWHRLIIIICSLGVVYHW